MQFQQHLLRIVLSASMLLILNWAAGQGSPTGFRNGDYLNKPFPLQGLRTMDGDSLRPGMFQGKPLWIHFWFIQCPPCVEELPELNRVAARYADSVQFLAITFDPSEAVKRFLSTHPFPFLHATDARNYIDALRLTRYPRNILVDRFGRVSRITDGLRSTAGPAGTTAQTGYGKSFEVFLDELIRIR